MKRIAMISYHTCPLSSEEGKETGGMNVYVLELSRKLAARGYMVDVFTRDQDTNSEKIVVVDANFRVIHLASGPKKSVDKKKLLGYLPEFTKNFLAFTAKEKITYDILDCHYYLSGLIGMQINENTTDTMPLIMTFHTLSLMKNLVARDENEREDMERICAEFTLVEKADKIISASEADASYLAYLYNCPKEKIIIITPGVNVDVFKPMAKAQARTFIHAHEKNKIILFAGRIEPLKGIDVLIFALKILLEKNPSLNVCLWIVGGDISKDISFWSKELQKLEELRRLLSITAEVKFVGKKPTEELLYYYNAADIVVLPSQYERFGMTALEAMACGIPVITTNATGISEFLDEKHGALVTSPNNPLMLSAQIAYLLTNEAAHEKIGKQVLETALLLSWKNIAKSVATLYENLS